MDQAAISAQIEKILRSHSFASKGQLRKLLEVLHRNMDAQATLKPDRVIKELWPNETKTKSSADVATEMNRLRHALESYYNREGKADPITICLPNRTVPGPDGLPEKRWIIAKPRGGIEDLPPGPPVNSRRGLKTMVAMAAIACPMHCGLHSRPNADSAWPAPVRAPGRFYTYDSECGRKGALEQELS